MANTLKALHILKFWASKNTLTTIAPLIVVTWSDKPKDSPTLDQYRSHLLGQVTRQQLFRLSRGQHAWKIEDDKD